MKHRSTYALVDLGALKANLREARRLSGGVRVCAVVKADAYGHGALAVAKALEAEAVDFLAVAFLEEALSLRDGGVEAPILVLGITDPDNAGLVVSRGISQTVYTPELALSLSRAAADLGRSAKIHLKIDTGMHRQGIAWGETRRFAELLAGLPGLEVEGAYSHFAESDSEDEAFSRLQIGRFEESLRAMRAAGIAPRIAHLANSAAVRRLPEARFDMVRPGILLYGLSPGGSKGPPPGFRPVMSLRSAVVSIRRIPAGEGLSYGRTCILARDSLVGLLQVGYADGYPWILSNRARVLIGGRAAPVLGRVCMDQTLVDLTDLPGVRLGEEALLFGDEALPVGELSALAGTIDYEIVCGISPRVPRIYKE